MEQPGRVERLDLELAPGEALAVEQLQQASVDRVGVRPAVGRRGQQADDARDSKAATLIGAMPTMRPIGQPSPSSSW